MQSCRERTVRPLALLRLLSIIGFLARCDLCVSITTYEVFKKLSPLRSRDWLVDVALCEYIGHLRYVTNGGQKNRTDPSVGRSRVRECGTSGHAAAH